MKRGVLKRVLCGGLAAAMVFSMAACGGGTGTTAVNSTEEKTTEAKASGEQKVIKFMHRFPDEPYNSFIESKLHEYEAMHPEIKFEITSAQNQEYKEKIKIVVGGDDTPDIFFSWVGDFTERFIREDLILDLTPYMEADQEWKDSLIESQIEQYINKDGMLYGIPFRLDCKLFFYNSKIFEENNIQVPKTWDEFMAACETLKAAGITPIAYGNQEPWSASHYIGTLNQIFVPDDVRAKDYDPASGEFTDPGYVEALEHYQSLLPYMTENPNGVKPDMGRTNFVMEMAAMYYAELIEIPYIKQDNPDMNFGMFNFPKVEGAKGNQDILTGVPEGFVVSSKTQYPDECVEFLKWFLGKEVGTQQCQEIGWFNAAKGTTEGLTDTALLDGYQAVMDAKAMSAWLDNALYSTVCDEYLTTVSDLTNGDITPEEAMAKIQVKAKEAQTLVGTGK
ncbi:ABC transporter substrate-binding protein [Lacrimispora sp.]|uniref:ABC transporter substrate-binding protein n=1 Tax=Lacrimispora sp. TaxID=2719234 RepID=UPI003461325F